MIKKSKIFEVFEEQSKKGRFLFTKNLVPNAQVYGEELREEQGVQYRAWDASKSKICSGILKGATNIGIRKESTILYLGCATGTTVSHVSDMIGPKGTIFAVDLSPTVMREMVLLSEKRTNIIPILESASHLASLSTRVTLVDVVFQDIAQSDQVKTFIANVHAFMNPKGYALLALKARSIDVTKKPKAIYKHVRNELEKHLKIIDYRELDPFQKDHCLFICKK